jgi:hypothetical protein
MRQGVFGFLKSWLAFEATDFDVCSFFAILTPYTRECFGVLMAMRACDTRSLEAVPHGLLGLVLQSV